jgi:DNA-directed RNA polymerase specialized sigma24 family protein
MIAPTNPNTVLPPHLVARRATDLSRRIYASMPWGYRVATLLTVLAADALDTFGRAMSAEMILAAVRGMPDIGGKSSTDWIQDVHRKGADTLPSGTGREFAARTYKILLTRFDAEIAEEAMSAVLLASARKKIHITNGSSARDAESYIITACLNAARDLLRARGRRREDSLVRDRDDDGVETTDVTDPEAFRDLEESISRKDMAQILHDAERISPRAREYLEVVLRGDSQSDWARELGVTDAAVSKFVRKIRAPLQKMLIEHLRSAATFRSYDRQ